MFTLKLIPILWAVIVLCNLLTKKLVPDLMTWYPIYSIIVGALTTVLLVLSHFNNDSIQQFHFSYKQIIIAFSTLRELFQQNHISA